MTFENNQKLRIENQAYKTAQEFWTIDHFAKTLSGHISSTERHGSTGILPVLESSDDPRSTERHGLEAHATKKNQATEMHGLEARATKEAQAAGRHGLEARATKEDSAAGRAQAAKDNPRSTGILPVPKTTENHKSKEHAKFTIRKGAYLPHWTSENSIYAVTFRLADSLPQSILKMWKLERENIVKRKKAAGKPLTKKEEQKLNWALSEKIEAYLDSGYGRCFLRNPNIAELVSNALKFFEGQRYILLAWAVMPNHVHAVVQTKEGYDLPGILHSWKSYTSNKAKQALNIKQQFWHAEYYDHLVRDKEDLNNQMTYVLSNPKQAGLKNWNWMGSRVGIKDGLSDFDTQKEHGLEARATKEARGTGKNWATFISGISIDSRTIKKGEAFIAIKGPNFDGHDFIDQALANGAALVIADKKSISEERAVTDNSRTVLAVDDTITALQTLARAWRDILTQSGTCVIAVAGSNGKTTTRRLIHTVLQGAACPLSNKKLRGYQSPASFNNHLGTALTLLKTEADDDFVVAEIGTNCPGEIKMLAKIVQPDVAVITSIGQEHLEFFGNIKEVAKEEAALLKVMKNGQWKNENENEKVGAKTNCVNAGVVSKLRGRAFIEHSALKTINQFAPPPKELTIIPYSAPPHEDTALGAKIKLADEHGLTGDDIQFTLPLFGQHNAANAGAAIALAQYAGIDKKTIASNLSKASPAPGRFQLQRSADITFINDAYNANPDSMIKSLDTFARLKVPGKKIAVLGDMLELGTEAQTLHEQIGEHLLKLAKGGLAIDQLILIGQLARHIGTPLKARRQMNGDSIPQLKQETHPKNHLQIELFDDFQERQVDKIADFFSADDTVLLKASRAMKLERIIEKYHEKSSSNAKRQ